VSVRRTDQVAGPPTKALAALCTAGENLGYTVRCVDADRGVVVMTGPITAQALSFGYIATAFVERADAGSKLHLDITPRLGFWALGGAGDEGTELVNETRNVLQAPKARIRRPEIADPSDRPFGYRPQALGLAWTLLSWFVYAVGFGGILLASGIAGTIGGLLLIYPLSNRAWNGLLTGLALLSFPFGILGAIGRHKGRTQALWRDLKGQPSAVRG
jgi:hypothetical protein